MKKTDILTSDILIVDRVINYDALTAAQQVVVDGLIQKFQMELDKKHSFKTKSDFWDFAATLQSVGIKTRDVPGGSSANTVTTLSKLLPDQVQTSFIGVAGAPDNPYGKMIRDGLSEAGVRLVEPEGNVGEPSISFVVVKGGHRSIITHSGSAREVFSDPDLRARLLTDDKVQYTDAILLQGSLPYKFGETTPVLDGYAPDQHLGVADWLLKKRWEFGKDLYITMPTQADFSIKYDARGQEIKLTKEEQEARHEEKARYYRWLVESANVVMGNGEELSRVYTWQEERREMLAVIEKAGGARRKQETAGDYLARIANVVGTERYQDLIEKYDLLNVSVHSDTAIERIHDILKQNPLAHTNFKGNKSQIAFITLGKEGAAIINKEGWTKVPTAALEDKDIVNTLGAGDTSYAGMLAGHILKKKNLELTDVDCANLGMWLAREKLKCDGARIPDPLHALVDTLKEEVVDPFIKKMQSLFLPTVNRLKNAIGSLGWSAAGHFH